MSTIPTPTLSTRSHYSYELDPPLTVERADVVTDANGFTRRPFEGDVCRVGVFIHEYEGKPRPTVVVASTTTSRSVSCGVPLDGFPAGPNDDPRLLDVFADLIADAEQRHRYEAAERAEDADAKLLARGLVDIENAKRAHPVFGYEQPATDDFTPADLGHVEPTHLCQHGNLIHPCACTFPQDHGRRLCPGVNANA